MSQISVNAIQQGTVIDHIPAGKALKIMYLLSLDLRETRMRFEVKADPGVRNAAYLRYVSIAAQDLTPNFGPEPTFRVSPVSIIGPLQGKYGAQNQSFQPTWKTQDEKQSYYETHSPSLGKKRLNLGNVQHQITLGLNLTSQRLGLKDLIKIKDRQLNSEEINLIALFAPQATLNRIQAFKVHEKFQITLPKEVKEYLLCSNPNCISITEKLKSHFSVSSTAKRVQLKCYYCEQNNRLL